jgi:hypothetical protein
VPGSFCLMWPVIACPPVKELSYRGEHSLEFGLGTEIQEMGAV